MYSTKLNGTTVIASEFGYPKAYITEAQADAVAEKVNGMAFQIWHGGCFYVQVDDNPQIAEQLASEGMNVLRNHPTIGKLLARKR